MYSNQPIDKHKLHLSISNFIYKSIINEIVFYRKRDRYIYRFDQKIAIVFNFYKMYVIKKKYSKKLKNLKYGGEKIIMLAFR